MRLMDVSDIAKNANLVYHLVIGSWLIGDISLLIEWLPALLQIPIYTSWAISIPSSSGAAADIVITPRQMLSFNEDRPTMKATGQAMPKKPFAMILFLES